MHAKDVIVIGDNDHTVQVELLDMGPPPLSITIEVEPEDVPQESELGPDAPRRSTRTRVQRQLFSPQNKGKYHKAVGFSEAGGESVTGAPKFDDSILTQLAEELNSLRTENDVGRTTDNGPEGEGEPNPVRNEFPKETLHYLDSVKAWRGLSSRGPKDPGVLHPPRNGVKGDPESKMVREMYERVGYSTKRGLIHLEVGQGGPPPRPMNEEECKSHVVGLVLAQMYSLKKGTKNFGEKVDEATLKELSQIDDFKTYKLLHKHD